ncbi:CU044_5270 family protein [Streptosporangium sp. CA-115845]|uniref:CU044_5270 family protein n=1 Tax=Streptosporangium sp. CA-115845 TaxID=3240071 RepID=UPI003D8CAB2F
MDDLTAVRDLLAEPEPSHEVIAAGRDRLLAAMPSPQGPPREQARRGRRAAWWTALGMGVVGTAAAATLVITSSTAAPPTPPLTRLPAPGTQNTVAEARQVLLAAATAAARAPAEGAYWVTRTVQGNQRVAPNAGYLILRSHAEEMWLSRARDGQSWRISQYLGAKPATPKDEAAWRKDGSPDRWLFADGALTGGYVSAEERIESEPGEREAFRLRGKWKGSAGHLTKGLLTWAEVRAIPDTPEKLRIYLNGRGKEFTAKWPGAEKQVEPWLLEDCVQLLTSLPVTPGTRAAAYRLLASLPGMTSEGKVVDGLGRIGQAISYPVSTTTPQGESKVYGTNRLVIDVSSGLPLSRERDGLDRLRDGRTYKVTSFTAYERIGWTDDLPDLPARHD